MAADLHRARQLSAPVGAAAGFVGAVAGSGGAAVIVPLLTRSCASIPQRVLAGTSAAAVLATASTATLSFASAGLIDLPASLLIFPPAMAMAPLGARFTSRLDCSALKRLLGYFLLAAAPLIPLKAWLFAGRAAPQQQQQQQQAGDAAAATAAAAAQQPVAGSSSGSSGSESSSGMGSWSQRLAAGMPSTPVAATLVATGGVAGFAGGLLGIGPAMIIVPVVALVTPWAQAKVLGTTLAAMVPTSAAALLQHHRLGNVDWRMAAGFAVGTVLGGAAGSQAAVHAPPGVLEGVFTVVTLVLARMTLKAVTKR